MTGSSFIIVVLADSLATAGGAGLMCGHVLYHPQDLFAHAKRQVSGCIVLSDKATTHGFHFQREHLSIIYLHQLDHLAKKPVLANPYFSKMPSFSK